MDAEKKKEIWGLLTQAQRIELTQDMAQVDKMRESGTNGWSMAATLAALRWHIASNRARGLIDHPDEPSPAPGPAATVTPIGGEAIPPHARATLESKALRTDWPFVRRMVHWLAERDKSETRRLIILCGDQVGKTTAACMAIHSKWVDESTTQGRGFFDVPSLARKLCTSTREADAWSEQAGRMQIAVLDHLEDSLSPTERKRLVQFVRLRTQRGLWTAITSPLTKQALDEAFGPEWARMARTRAETAQQTSLAVVPS